MRESAQQTPSFGDAHAATLLLRELIDVTDDFERALAGELAINATDLSAMEHLIASGPLSPTALAERLELSTAAVTTVIDRLEASGHAHRAPNPEDRRGTLVVPAPASVGRAMQRIVPMVTAVDQAIRAFPPEEQEIIVRYLGTVVEAYRGHAGDTDRVRSWKRPEGAGSPSPEGRAG